MKLRQRASTHLLREGHFPDRYEHCVWVHCFSLLSRWDYRPVSLGLPNSIFWEEESLFLTEFQDTNALMTFPSNPQLLILGSVSANSVLTWPPSAEWYWAYLFSTSQTDWLCKALLTTYPEIQSPFLLDNRTLFLVGTKSCIPQPFLQPDVISSSIKWLC